MPSEAAAARLADLGLPRDRMHVLPNFLADDEFADESHARERQYALFAGRLVEEKGVDTAIEAARHAGVPLLIAGAGPDAERLEELARERRCSFAGRLSARALAEARRRAAFAVVPSRWDEPCPYAVIEAMAAGLPVLASSSAACPRWSGAAHAVLPPRDASRWAAAMGAAVERRATSERRVEHALDAARELFGAERFYSGLMNVYDSALAQP